MNAAATEVVLRIPGRREYVMVLRTALGGAAFVNNLSVEDMDDLRTAADEACECLLHQGRRVQALEMRLKDQGPTMTLSLGAEFCPGEGEPCDDQLEISRAVLETLVPEVRLYQHDSGCVERIELSFAKTVQ